MSKTTGSRRWFQRFILSLGIFGLAAVPAGGVIEVVYPQPGSWTERADHLIIKLNRFDLTGLRVTVNGVESDLLPVGTPDYRRTFQDVVILRPLWDPGENTLVVESVQNGAVVDSRTDKIFYAPKGGGTPPPEGIPQSVMHLSSRETPCAGCHVMNPTPEQVTKQTGKKNPCYGCHRSLTSPPYVHGPVGTFACVYCHTLSGDPKYATPRRDESLCGECHVETLKQIRGMKLRHGPIDVGMCEICHDPHGSDHPYMMRKPVNELCLSCHEDVAKGIHVVRTTRNESHPLSGKPDLNPKRQGGELSCVSCHNPHGGVYRYYFQNGEEDRMTLCQYCHQK